MEQEYNAQVKMTPEETGPKEPWFIKIHVFLLAAASLTTFNTFLSLLTFFTEMFPEYHPLYYFSAASQSATFLVSIFLGPISNYVSSRVRISLSALILSVLLTLFPLIVYLLRETMLGYVLFFAQIFTCILFSTLLQGSSFGFAVLLGPHLGGNFGQGLAFGGMMVVSIRMFAQEIFPKNLETSLIIFFAWDFCLIIFVAISHFFIERHEFTLYQMEKIRKREEMESHNGQKTRRTLGFMAKVQWEIFHYSIEIMVLLMVTLSVFPTLVCANQITFLKDAWSSLVIVFTFNIMDLLARFTAAPLAGLFLSDFWVSLITYLRLGFIPLFVFLKYKEPSFVTDILILVSVVLLALTNGTISNTLYVRGPSKKGLPASMKEPSGFIMLLSLVTGLLIGSIMAGFLNSIEF